jgi:hypothetical protein
MYLSISNLWFLPVLYFFLPESLSWLIMQRQLDRANRVKDRLIGTTTTTQKTGTGIPTFPHL